MSRKKIGSMNYYEILNVKPNATQQEIEKAYLLGIATYHRDSIAAYSLIDDNEKQYMLNKIKEAFVTLGNPMKRETYDSHELHHKNFSMELASFRKSTEKVLIEDADESGFWKKLKFKYSARKKSNIKMIG